MEFTRSVAQKYIKSNNKNCPYCGCSDTEYLGSYSKPTWIMNKIKCHDCGREWYEYYELTDIFTIN
jgi:transposase-like protein